jgi:hypothetical protein
MFIVDISISKTFGEFQKSIADIFTRSANQGNRRNREIVFRVFHEASQFIDSVSERNLPDLVNSACFGNHDASDPGRIAASNNVAFRPLEVLTLGPKLGSSREFKSRSGKSC